MVSFFLLLGSNQGDRMEQLRLAASKIEEAIGSIKKSSSLYETAAWGNTDQPNFLNQALIVESILSPTQALAAIHALEIEMGRKRMIKWGERIIDIDILYADDLIVDLPHLKIPHPEIQNRRFVLVPLAEIAPHYVHPAIQKTNVEMLSSCQDPLSVTEY